jgi:dimethylhistidine N-methyltransferase
LFWPVTDNFRFHLIPASPTDLAAEALAGLRARPKRLPCKLFYDEAGLALFEAICATPEYDLCRNETALLRTQAASIADAVGRGACLVEPGAGGCEKVGLLLDALAPAAYAPLDIAGESLERAAQALAARRPGLRVTACAMDFLADLERIAPLLPDGRRVFFYPGSSIGNFTPEEAIALLARFRRLAGTDGGLLIGFDCKKHPGRISRAYNDEQGLTARFNLNLLGHANRLLDGNFDPGGFAHHAFYEPVEGRIEMHLVSLRDQTVRIAGGEISFSRGETLHTENSYKYLPGEFAALAGAAGWAPAGEWLAEEAAFAVQHFRAA